MSETDISLFENETITILVYTESFSNFPQAIEYFEKIDAFEEFEINYLPILNKETKINVSQCTYKHRREKNIIYSTIKLKNSSGCIGTHNRILFENFDALTEDELNLLSEKIILEGNTYAAPFDVVVVSNEWAHKAHPLPSQTIPFSKFKEFIRLFMINNHKFYIKPHYSIDEFCYYIFRHKYLFKNFQHFWSSNVHSLDDYNDALDNRLLQFSICLDKAKSLLWQKQNNITAMHLKYHISYLILLSTGIFDNLAWIINNYYALDLGKNSRLNIDLKIYGKKDTFIKSLSKKSPILASFIKSDTVQRKIEVIREFRDRIVHRDFIKTIASGNSKQTRHNYLMVDAEAKDMLINAGFSRSSFPFSTNAVICADIADFTDFIEDSVVYITDGLLEIINNELFNGNKQVIIWAMLDFPCEPYIL